MDFFFGLGHQDKVMNTEVECADLPEYVSMGLLPVGATASAGLLCVDTRREDGETIVYLDAADHWGEPAKKRRYVVARDVHSFLSQLKLEPN